MTQQLIVSSIEVPRFGGLEARRVALPTEPFVVISGRNETGKSTLAEVLSWLIAGPSGTAAEARRFGAVNDRIGGVLRGWLDTCELEISGEFRIPKSGAPNDRGIVVRCGGTLDAPSWRAKLGGIDPQVFAAIYRLSGEQLHTGLGAHEQLSQVALSTLSRRVDPYHLAGRLSAQARTMSAGKAAGVVSIASLQRSIGEVDAELRSARGTAELHRQLTDELSRQDSERDLLHHTLSTLSDQRRQTLLAIEVWKRRQTVDQLRHELALMEVVPPAWHEVISDPVAVRDAYQESRVAAEEGASANSALETRAREMGGDIAMASRVRVVDTDLSTIAREVAQVGSIDESIRQASDQRAHLESKLAVLAEVTEERVRSVGLVNSPIADLRFEVGDQARLSAAVSRWDDGVDHAAECRNQARGAAEAHRRAGEELLQAETAWQRWLPDVAAEQWLMGDRLVANEQTLAGSRWWVRALPWLLLLVILTVAGIAVLESQFAIAAVAALGVVIAAAMATVGGVFRHAPARRRVPVSTDEATEPDTASLGNNMHAAAIRVVEARRTVDVAELDRSSAAALVERSSAAVVAARNSVESLAADLGLQLEMGDPSGVDAQITAYASVVEALAASTATATELADVKNSVLALEKSRAGVEHRIRQSLAEVGITDVSSLETADELVAQYRVLHGLWVTTEQLRARRCAADAKVEQLTQAVRDQISNWRPERVIEEADRLRAVDDSHTELDAQLRAAEADLDARLGTDIEVRASMDNYGDLAEIHRHLETIEAEHAATAERVRRSSELIGEYKARLEELAGVERLAALVVQRGTLRQQQEEIAVDAVIAAVAERMLRSAAQRFEREHQPALIERTLELTRTVAPEWTGLIARPGGPDRTELLLGHRGGAHLPIERLSTGARALLYLALRVAMADQDAQQRRVSVPLICDDPLVHLDDDRARDAMRLLRSAAEAGRQVMVFTCHQRTVDAALAEGAGLVRL